jgi:hypothetical protein
VDEERSTKLIFPMLQLLAKLDFNLGQLSSNALPHLLLSKKLTGIALLALVAATHEAGGILARGGQSLAVRQQAAMLLNHLQSRSTLLLEGFQTRDLGLVGLEQRITAHIRESRCEVKHLFLGEEEAIPKFLQTAASIFDKQVHVLSFQFVETSEFLFEFIDSAHSTTTVGSEESLAISLLNTEAFPEALYIGAELLDLALTSLFLFHQFIALGHQVGKVRFVQSELLRRFAIILDDVGICLHLGSPELSPHLDDLFGSGLDECNAAMVFFVDPAEFGIKGCNIVGGEVEAGRNC